MSLPPNVQLEQLAEFHNNISGEFPEKKDRRMMSSEIHFHADHEQPEVINLSGVDGYLFISVDQTKLLQVSLSSFSFHKLKPYSNWHEFRTEARRL